MFCSVLVEIGLAEEKLSLTTEQRNQVLKAWNAVEEHDKQPQKFNQLYRTHWGNTLYCRTKRDDLVDAALIQRVKMAKRYAPAQQDISAQHNRLMYTLVKLLWLRSPQGSRNSPEKRTLLKAYERVQHRILVEDPVLCKAGIPLPKINSKTVQDFIRRQERLLNLHATKQPSTITKTTSISSADLPPAPHQPAVLPPPDYPLMEYVPTPSTAGTKVLKGRTDMMAPLSRPQPPMPHLLLPPPVRKPNAPSTINRPVPSLSASTATPGIAGPSTWPIMPASEANPGIDGPPKSVPPTLPKMPTTIGTAHSSSTSFWARATQFKRKHKEHSSEVGAKVSRVQNLLSVHSVAKQPRDIKKYKKRVSALQI
ncbi:uncharacterized protein LOC123484214 [Coregonus clupeaformis]|uniref:uncharacterized protein LOC123484214 n=1 Tax=Coregonus clupeaformis TaxID=59861 RepID=UPI001E1C9CB9|nr:uncharacterized protein LOC123484214 [Coregonus clupeaformis]